MPATREDIPHEGSAMHGYTDKYAAFRDINKYQSATCSVPLMCRRGLSATSTTSAHSNVYYSGYRKMVNDNLAKINSNISEMLIESFKGIDTICSKVRDCISDFHPAPPPLPTYIPQPPPYTESFADDMQTLNMLAKQTRELERPKTPKYMDISLRYEEYRSRARANKHTFNDERKSSIEDKSRFSDKCWSQNEFQYSGTKYEEARQSKEQIHDDERTSRYVEMPLYEVNNQELPQMENWIQTDKQPLCAANTAVEENNEEFESSCLIESIASMVKITNSDDTTVADEIEQDSTDVKTLVDVSKTDGSQYLTQSIDTGKGEDISEITELSVHDNAKEQKQRKPKKCRSKSKMERTKRRRQRKSLEEYTQAVKQQVDNADLNSLQAIIQNLTERIDMLSSQSMDFKFEDTTKLSRPTSAKYSSGDTSESADVNHTTEVERQISAKAVSNTKSIRDLLGSALSRALAAKRSLPVRRGKPRLNLTEVYHRPGVTNLHKRLLAQLEANDSFICFQRLMAKQKGENKGKKIFSKINIPITSNSVQGLKTDVSSSPRDFEDAKFNETPCREGHRQKTDLRSKYADSLWFNEKKMYKEKTSKNHHHNHQKDKKSRSMKASSNYSSATIGTECTEKSNVTAMRNISSRRTRSTPFKRSKPISRLNSAPAMKMPSTKKLKSEKVDLKSLETSKMNVWFSKRKKEKNEKHPVKAKDKKSTTKPEPGNKFKSKCSSPSSGRVRNDVKTKTSTENYNPKNRIVRSLSAGKKYSLSDEYTNNPRSVTLRQPRDRFKRTNSLTSTNNSNSSINTYRSKSSVGSMYKSNLSLGSSPRSNPPSSRKLTKSPCFSNDKKIPSTHQSNVIKPLLINKNDQRMCQCGVTVSNDSKESRTTTTVKTRIHWMKPKNDTNMPIRKLEYLDILDDLTQKDLLPLRSEYPRRDLVVDEKLGLQQNRDIQETYLWRMMYGKEKNDSLWSHLLQPNVDCMDRSCNFCEHQEREKWTSVDNKLKSEKDWTARSGLFDSLDKVNRKLKSERSGLFDVPDKVVKSVKQKSKRKIIETLSPYLFDPKEERNNQTLIVMPVKVFYDNAPPIKIMKNNSDVISEVIPIVIPKTVKKAKIPKLELPAIKEIKTTTRAKWIRPTTPAKPKKVVASIQKEGGSTPKTVKIHSARLEEPKESPKEKEKTTSPRSIKYFGTMEQIEPQKLTPQQVAYKKAIMRNLNRLMNIREKDKKDQQLNPNKDVPVVPPKAQTPHYARATIQSQNYAQRSNNPSPEQKNENDKKVKTNAMNSPRKSIDGSPSPHLNEFDKNIVESKSDFERKMLSFKYGKSVGEQLVSFLNHQPPSPDLLIAPAPPNSMFMPKSMGTMGTKPLISNPNVTKGNSVKPHPFQKPPALRRKQMIMNMRGAKQKNNQIQSNIQKAIGVIESQMVDILSAPGDSASVEAFDIMEKEITQVLSMMKTEGLESEFVGQRPILESEFETISKNLFSKLEKILDYERSKTSISASDTEGRESVISSVCDKLKLSRSADRLQQCSSATTTSQEENSNTARRNLKQKVKKLSRVKSDTKLKELKYSPAEKETLNVAENELAMGENIKREDSISEHIYDRKEDIEKDQGDQPEKENVKKPEPEYPGTDLDVIWDTADQIQRLDNILKESKDGEETNTFENALQREREKDLLLQKIKVSTPLDDFDGTMDDYDEEESKDQLDFLSSRINALLESPCKEEISTIPRNEESAIISHKNDPSSSPYKDEIISHSKSSHRIKIPPKSHTLSNSPRRNELLSIPQLPNKEDPSTTTLSKDTAPRQDEMYTCLGSDDLQSSSLEFLTPPLTEVRLGGDAEGEVLKPLDKFENPILPDSDGSSSDISDQVNKIIKRVEDIYAQLDDFQTTNDDQQPVPVFTDTKNVPNVKSEEFLTPFMQAVRDKRTKQQQGESSAPALVETTPSYYNILHFLDTLNEIETEKAQEIHTARMYKCAHAYNMPTVLHQATLEYPVEYNVAEKPSCMKKCDYKNKKKVSFLVLKESKSAQVCIDPLHKIKRIKLSDEQTPALEGSKTNLEEVCLKKPTPFSVSKEVQNVDESKIIQVGSEGPLAESSSEESEKTESSEDSYFSSEAVLPAESPSIEVYYNTSEESMSDVAHKQYVVNGSYGTQIMQIKNQKTKPKWRPNVEIFNEISNMADLLKRPKNLGQFSQSANNQQLDPSTENLLVDIKENNVVFLRSFYAIMYILVFTALNMEYKCY